MSIQQSFARPNSSQTNTHTTFQYSRRYTARCPLGALAIKQISALQLRATAIIQKMGYPPQHTIAATDRLRYVLCSPVLGLDGSYIDAYYNAQDFLQALLNILQLSPQQYEDDVSSILQTLDK